MQKLCIFFSKDVNLHQTRSCGGPTFSGWPRPCRSLLLLCRHKLKSLKSWFSVEISGVGRGQPSLTFAWWFNPSTAEIYVGLGEKLGQKCDEVLYDPESRQISNFNSEINELFFFENIKIIISLNDIPHYT